MTEELCPPQTSPETRVAYPPLKALLLLSLALAAGPFLIAHPSPEASAGQPSDPGVEIQPALSNHFLRSVNPPADCAGADVATLTQSLTAPITGTTENGEPRELGGFVLEVNFDPDLVCVTMLPGSAVQNSQNRNMICLVRDVDPYYPPGVYRLNCATSPDYCCPDTTTPEGRELGIIEVRPQPALYETVFPHQDNGLPVELLSVECDLWDQDGKAITAASCDGAHVTIRALEGAVDASCRVDSTDTQLIAFRLTGDIGTLPSPRFDLVPPGGDGEIDINDVQFVLGRHGSTCAQPNPPQPPLSPAG